MKSAPTAAIPLRIAALFKRRPQTAWAEKEIKQYKTLVKQGCFEHIEDLELVEQYYAFERKRGEQGRHRRDLYTFLNNFTGELDRATAWREAHPIVKPPRKIIPIELPSEPFVPPTDPAELEALARFNEHFSAFKKVRNVMKGTV